MIARIFKSMLVTLALAGLAGCAGGKPANLAQGQVSWSCPGANGDSAYSMCDKGGRNGSRPVVMISDMRLKEDIRLVGRTFDGLNVYTFHYRGDPVVRMGVMAQEVLKVHPQAVKEIDGYLAVDYSQIGTPPAH